MEAGEEAKALQLFLCCSPSPSTFYVQAGGCPPHTHTHRQVHERSTAAESHLCCVFPSLGQVVSALESNPTARRTQLHHKFEQVIALVEDNIYECCSEA